MGPDEHAAVTSGSSFWRTTEVEGVRSVLLTDGPHGVRKQAGSGSVLTGTPATCFPPAVATAATWDRSLLRRMGEALGEEARALGVGVLLGPGVNLKRSPLGGRNFEYFSEAPLLTGELAAQWVLGVQSKGVGASLKHFAVNSQETDRMTISADVDERAVRELLAVQSSDWAFMVEGDLAGPYPRERLEAHLEALGEALGPVPSQEQAIGNLAPDLSLAPILEP